MDGSRRTDSGIEIKPLYTADDLAGWDPATQLGAARRAAVHARRLPDDVPRPAVDDAPVRRLRHAPRRPTSASSSCSNAGQTGLSCAFDLPTQMGYDSDHPRAEGEVGKVGVAIDSIDDMRAAARRPPARQGHDVDDDQLDGGDPAAAVRARRRGAGRRRRRRSAGTIQNDLLKEYIARGTYIYPPRPSMRIITDIFAYCAERIPQLEHDLDLRLPHPRGRLDGGAGDRLHARQRHRLRAGGDRRRPRRRRVRARGCRSSGTATTTSSRRSPSSAPPGACGTAS